MRRTSRTRWRHTGISSVVAPVASFTGAGLSGSIPLTTIFTDASTHTPTSWAWTFGDGGTSAVQHPTHVYTSVGTYTVALTATNVAGSNMMTRTAYVTASSVAVPAQVTGLVATALGSTSVGLEWALPSGTPTDYLVEYKATSSGIWLVFADGTSTLRSATVTGLTASTGYDFRVSAINGSGTGAVSATANATTSAGVVGSVTITWQPPTLDGDNTPIADIASYKVYWGTTSGGPYTADSGAITAPHVWASGVGASGLGVTEYTYTTPSLAPGTWYFVMTTTDSGGNESDYGAETPKVVT